MRTRTRRGNASAARTAPARRPNPTNDDRREEVGERGTREHERAIQLPLGVAERVRRCRRCSRAAGAGSRRPRSARRSTAACAAGRARAARAASSVVPVRRCTLLAQRRRARSHRRRSRRRIGRGNASGCRSGNGRRDPVRSEPVDRGVDRGVDADEQRGLDEQLRDVTRRAVARVAASSASSKSTRWGWSTASTMTFSSARLRCAMRPWSSTPTSVHSRSRSARSMRAGSISVRRSPDELGDDHRRAVRRRDRCRRAAASTRPLSSARRSASASCSMRRCTVAIRRFDLVAAQADGSVEPGEVVGAAIVGSPQLHEHLRSVAASVTRYVSVSVGVLRWRTRAGRGPRLASACDELERVGCPIGCAEHDERERSRRRHRPRPRARRRARRSPTTARAGA